MGEKTAQEMQLEEDYSELDNLSFEEKLAFVTPIAEPMAPKKLTKKLLKLLSKANGHNAISRGLKDVPKGIKKAKISPGLVIIAGDVTPIDIAAHIPIFLEERDIPYVYVPSKRDTGLALKARKGVALAAIERRKDFGELFDYCLAKVKALPLPIY